MKTTNTMKKIKLSIAYWKNEKPETKTTYTTRIKYYNKTDFKDVYEIIKHYTKELKKELKVKYLNIRYVQFYE